MPTIRVSRTHCCLSCETFDPEVRHTMRWSCVRTARFGAARTRARVIIGAPASGRLFSEVMP